MFGCAKAADSDSAPAGTPRFQEGQRPKTARRPTRRRSDLAGYDDCIDRASVAPRSGGGIVRTNSTRIRTNSIRVQTNSTRAPNPGAFFEWTSVGSTFPGSFAGMTAHGLSGTVGSVHQASELLEQVAAVVRAGGGLGVVLDAEDGEAGVAESFEGLIVEIDVAGDDVGGECRGVDREAVVLGGDLDLAVPLVADRVIGTAMTELELECLSAERLAQKLMAQADAEDRALRATRRRSGSAFRSSRWPRSGRRGSPGPFERKMPSGSCSRTALGRRRAGHDCDPAADSTRWRGMFHFMPKSSATTCGRREPTPACRPPRSSNRDTARGDPGSQVVDAVGHHLADQVAARRGRGWPGRGRRG